MAKVGQIAEMPQDSAAFREDGCGYAAQVGRFGKTTLPLFIPEQIVPYKRTVTGALFLPTYPDESGLIAPIGESGYEVAEE